MLIKLRLKQKMIWFCYRKKRAKHNHTHILSKAVTCPTIFSKKTCRLLDKV